MLSALVLAVLTTSTVAAPATLYSDHPLTGSLWDTRSGQRAELETLLAEAAGRRWVLLGETHDNAQHHRLQARVVDGLGRSGRRLAVVWEMAEPEHAEALARADLDSVDALGPALDWEKRGWPAWPDYQPIAEAALSHRMTMLPGKPSPELARRVRQEDTELPADLASRLEWSRPYPEGVRAGLLEDLATSHCGQLPRSALAPMARVQRLWDAWMADAMERAAAPEGKAEQAILIAGRGHVREDRAVPWHLSGDSLTLALVEVAADRREAAAYSAFDPARFDYVWFTARVDREDPCASFEQ